MTFSEYISSELYAFMFYFLGNASSSFKYKFIHPFISSLFDISKPYIFTFWLFIGLMFFKLVLKTFSNIMKVRL